MNKKIITICVLTLVITPVITAAKSEIKHTEQNISESPDVPGITGPTAGIIGKSYEYIFTTVDPQGDDVYYKINWGDCAIQFWTGPYKSGEKVTFNHAWCEVCCGPGKFTICVQAKDIYDNEGFPGTLEVVMEKNNRQQSTINSLFLKFLGLLVELLPNLFPILKKVLLL